MSVQQPPPNNLIAFFALALLLALPSYVLVGLTDRGIILSPELAFSFVPLATFAPLVAALILTFRNGGWALTKSLLWRTFDFKRTSNKLWLVAALSIPPIIVGLAWGIASVLGLEVLPAQAPLIVAPLMFCIFFVGAASEQLGWMGYAYEPMESKWGTLKAALVLGLAVGVFHIPLYYFLIDDPVILAVQLLFPVSLRFLVVWTYNNAGKSIFAATIFHTAYNTSYSVLEVNIVVATTLSILAALGVAFFGGRR